MIVRPLSTVHNTRDYARVSHSRQWSNYNLRAQSDATDDLIYLSLYLTLNSQVLNSTQVY